METPYDWVTLAIFAGLIVVFLQRSTGEGEPRDSIWHYFPPSIGCAVSNYFGNEGLHLVGVAGIVLTLAYFYYVIDPFNRRQP